MPVGTIKNDAVENTINTTTITLGRYEFAEDGTPTPVQTNTIGGYSVEIGLSTYYYELQPNRTAESEPTAFGTISNGRSMNGEGNAIAIDINEWIQQANTNGGYYIGRYEASKNSTDSTKAASKSAAVWNYITQPNAAIAARKMYPDSSTAKVYSDLVNSYAWDTAIVFIQEYSGDGDYSTENAQTFSSSLQNTGTKGDKVCNIYDMASNTYEWTTEASTKSFNPCTSRGGSYLGSYIYCTSGRYYNGTSGGSGLNFSFRSTLCVK